MLSIGLELLDLSKLKFVLVDYNIFFNFMFAIAL